AKVINCTFTDNYGAVSNIGGTATLVNCTASGNHGAAAVEGVLGSTLSLVNCTISKNDGYGVFIDQSLFATSCKLLDTIVFGNGVAGNTLFVDVDGPLMGPVQNLRTISIVSLGNNLIGDSRATGWTTGDRIHQLTIVSPSGNSQTLLDDFDPLLGPLH